MNNVSRPHLLGMLAGLFLAVGLVLSTMLGATAWLKVRHSQFIKVKGSACKNVRADLVIWRGSFRVEAATLLDAQRELKAQVAKVSQFVRDRGLSNLLFAPIGIEEVNATLKDAEGLTRQRKKDGRVIGAIAIFRFEVRPFTQEQIDLVSTFANQAVIAIENVRLFKELQA